MLTETNSSPLQSTRDHARTLAPIMSTAVPGYEIQGELGRGGMGVVYKARHLELNRTVALKMILWGGLNSPDRIARFQREAKAIARLQHSNIVQLFDVGEAAGQPYFTMEYVEGGNLAWISRGVPLSMSEATLIVTKVARAVHAAHQQNLVHRDLKPANILMTLDGEPKIADFGLAKHLDQNSMQTESGAVLGTPCYMAPEQASGSSGAVGPAVDIYALGAILYQLLTGRPPFLGATTQETLQLILHSEPVPPRRLRPEIPNDIETICLTCLQREPVRRYATALALAEDLSNRAVGKRLAAPARWQQRRANSETWWKRIAGLLLLGNVVVLSWALLRSPSAPQGESSANSASPSADDDLKLDPQRFPERAAIAEILRDELESKKRVQAIRLLGEKDGRYFPEVTGLLVNALRADPVEEVRIETALALAKGNCANDATLSALMNTVLAQDKKDDYPAERSANVIAAAQKALEVIRPKVQLEATEPVPVVPKQKRSNGSGGS